jgi:hypothetical protein
MINMTRSTAFDTVQTLELNAERARLVEAHENTQPWYLWGTYLTERKWGTVREDHSPAGTAWDFFPHDHARSRTYRWGEDGLLGISDEKCRMSFALSLWNGEDPILKERLFGLTGSEGNHCEDVKEHYYFLDNTPTHSYMKALCKYPQSAFHYAELVAENRYFDITVEYAKVDPKDVLIRITATNRGPDTAPLHLLPTLWFRNSWAWGYDDHDPMPRPALRAVDVPSVLDGEKDYSLVHAAQHTAPFEHAEEVFKGDTGRGVGASHQRGWTALVAKLLEQTEGR